MDPLIPAPDDVVAQVFLWLGAPTVLVVALLTISSVLSWIDTAKRGISVASAATAAIRSWTPVTTRRAISSVASQSLLLSSSYALARSLPTGLMHSGSFLKDGQPYSLQDVVVDLVSFHGARPADKWVVTLIIGWILSINIACAIKSDSFLMLVHYFRYAVTAVLALVGVLFFIEGCSACGVSWDHQMAYIAWFSYICVALIFATGFCLHWSEHAAKRLYDYDHEI